MEEANQEKLFNKNFPKDTAGRKMILNIPKAKPDDTIASVEVLLSNETHGFETINYRLFSQTCG